MRGTIPENFRSRKKLVLKISSFLGFGHARAAFGQTRFSPVWYMFEDFTKYLPEITEDYQRSDPGIHDLDLSEGITED